MIDCTPASIAARNGASPSSTSPVTIGQLEVRVLLVSPWPGKCFAQAATPCACRPRDEGGDVARDELRVGAERADADDRVRGLALTSATGAKSRLTPTAARSAPIAAATCSVSATSSTAPSAALPGYELPRSVSSRVTSPPSSSIADQQVAAELARSDAVSAASCSRSRTL